MAIRRTEIPIEKLEISVYAVPTDFPEVDRAGQ